MEKKNLEDTKHKYNIELQKLNQTISRGIKLNAEKTSLQYKIAQMKQSLKDYNKLFQDLDKNTAELSGKTNNEILFAGSIENQISKIQVNNSQQVASTENKIEKMNDQSDQIYLLKEKICNYKEKIQENVKLATDLSVIE